MWLIFLTISITIIAGDPVNNPDCELPTHQACGADEIPDSFPASVAELDIACNAIKDYLLCGISMEERCGFEPDSIPVAHNFLTVVNRVCDKQSQLHKDIVENLECMSGFIEDRLGMWCFVPQPDEERIKNHEKALVDGGLLKSDDEINKGCLKIIHGFSCYALKMENTCGKAAMDVVIEMVVASPTALFGECEDEIGALLPAAVSLHKLEEELEATTELDVCNAPINETCIPDEAALIFPETQEQLDQACKAEIEFMECTIQTEEKCHFDPETLPYLINFLNITREVCSNDSALYKGIEAHIECVKPLFFDHFGECQNLTQDVEEIKMLATAIQNEGIPAFTLHEEDQGECLNGLFTFACSANKLEADCGGDALQAFVTLAYARTGNMFKKCNQEVNNHLHDVIHILNTQEEAKAEFQRLIAEAGIMRK